MPVKVEVSSFQPQSFMDNGEMNAAQFSSCEWASKVHSVAPFLNQKGLHRALAILDQAIFNVQRVKAMDDILTSTQQQGNGDPSYDLQCAMTCKMCVVQVQQEQQQLLVELQHLPLDPSAVRNDYALPHVPAQNQAQHRVMKNSAGGAQSTAQPMLAKNNSSETPKSTQKASERAKALQTPARRVQTLSTSLQLLSSEDPDCLFIVRRINKLGFKAVRTLKRHFSGQGPVAKVLLAHSTVRQHGDPTCHARRRPSSLGFVQMANAEAVNKVLALGAEQEVDGVLIRVQRFERQRISEEEEQEENENEAEETYLAGQCGFERGLSEASTTTSSSNATPTHAAKTATSDSDED
jgi:hypothetical protein